MSLRFLFAALLLHVTYVGSNRCPTLAQMGPCKCRDGPWGLEIFCNGNLVGEIGDALANVAHTKQPIYDMTLYGVWLPNLPPNFLLGHGVLQITIDNCSTSSVDKDAFVDMAATLKLLSLTDNALERVPSQALEKCFNLTHLYLYNNRIEIVHAGAFLGLHSLLDLSLLGNRIKFIDNSAFVGTGRQFRLVHLGGNELTAFPYLPLRNSSLEYLRLQSNKIASLLPGKIDATVGESLKYLDLRNNTIRHLPASVFRSMKRLKHLVLSENAIESIHAAAFEGPEGTLEYLSLGYNHLREVPSAALKNMTALKFLYLPGNKICKIGKDDFLTYGKTLIIIDLRNNSLEYLDANAFTALDSLSSMQLGSNQLKTLHFKTFALAPHKFWKLDIHDNPLHCDCNLRWLSMRSQMAVKRQESSWIVEMPEKTKCVTPEKYGNISLAEIAIDQLVCEDNKTYIPPEPCCNCVRDTKQSASNNDLMSILQIIATYFS